MRALIHVAFRGIVLSCLLPVGAAGVARAEESSERLVSVMTLLSETGDDTAALALSDALRERARTQPGWRVNDTRMSLSQLSLVHDCDPAEAACLEVIADAVDASLMVVGFMGQNDDGQLEVTLRIYERGAGFRPETAQAQVLTGAPDYASLAASLIEQLAGEGQADKPVPAVVQEQPAVQAGPAIDTASIELQLPEPRDDSLAWLGYTLVGVGALSAGLMVYSWTQIGAAEGDETFELYRKHVGEEAPQVSDVCDEADRGEAHGMSSGELQQVKDLCSQGQLNQIMQYVYMGVAVAAGAAGGIILWQDAQDGEHARLTLEPTFSLSGVGLGAHLQL